MTGSPSDYPPPGASAPKAQRLHYAILGAICALVIELYAWSSQSGRGEMGSLKAESAYYNLLVQGNRAGQLNLKRELPPELAQRLDASDRMARSYTWLMDHQLLDLSYYQGRLYLYFGVAPALVLFWPWAALTGHYLLHQDAVLIFFSVGFLAGAGLLGAVWRRYFAEVSVGVVAAGIVTFGLADFTLAILHRCGVYEVAISCGWALTMVTLTLLWQALYARRGKAGWLAAASLAYGLAVAARPSLLLGAVSLLVPVALFWRGRAALMPRPRLGTLLLAATGPIMTIGLGLLLYNILRFDHLWEFGQRWQLPLSWHQQFSPRFLWCNFQVGFLEPARWSGHFPFVHEIAVPSLPEGSGDVFEAFGVLTTIPVVWLGLAAPLAWRSRLTEMRSLLRWFLGAVALLFGAAALVLCFHDSMCLRYEAEFAPALAWLAVIGGFGLERALAGQPVWRLAVRWGWGLLLAFSVAFNLFQVVASSSQYCVSRGVIALQQGQLSEAAAQFQQALKLQPDNARAHNGFGSVLCQQGRVTEGISHMEEALRLKPSDAETQNNLGVTLFQLGRMAEAIDHCEEALRIRPHFANAHYNLGTALTRQGRLPEAIGHLERAVQLKPDYAQAHNNLAWALFEVGRVPEAMEHYDQALRLEPDFAAAHFNFAKALFRLGHLAQAIGHYEQAVRYKPEDANARNHLAWALATCADGSLRNGVRAVKLAEDANQLAGGRDPAMLDTLAAAYAEVGRFNDAVRTAQAALELAKGVGQADQAQRIEGRLELYRAGRPYHDQLRPGYR